MRRRTREIGETLDALAMDLPSLGNRLKETSEEDQAFKEFSEDG